MKFHLNRHTKRLLSAVLCGAMMFPMGVSALAADTDTIESSYFAEAQMNAVDLSDSGYALKRLGLVSGDDKGDLMLTKTGTRQEAFTIFIALLGERDDANNGGYSYTFKDVADWFANFAGYGVYRSYSAGYNATTFGANDTVTVQQYMTFILRALGYDTNDFTWSEATNKAVEIGLCTQSQANKWVNNSFRRQEIMEISYLALSTKLKGSESTLADKLIASGDITEAAAKAEGLSYGVTYAGSTTETVKKTIPHDTVEAGTFELHNVGTGKAMTADSISKQSDVQVAADTNAAAQQFEIITDSNGEFKIASASNTNLVLDANPTDGADAILWTANGTECQSFVAVQMSDGVYSIRLAGNASSALTVENGDVRLSEYTGAANQQWQFKENGEDTAAVAAKLQNIMTNIYPDGKYLGSGYSFGGASQCMGFGREVFYRLYGVTAKWSYDGSPKTTADSKLYTITAQSSSYSAASMKKLISQAKPGDILQMNSPKIHTMVFVSSDENGFTVYDANWSGPNQVDVRYVKYGAWATRNSTGICVLHATNYPQK